MAERSPFLASGEGEGGSVYALRERGKERENKRKKRGDKITFKQEIRSNSKGASEGLGGGVSFFFESAGVG